MSNENAEKLLTFIEQSPSAFHVVYNMRRQLDAAGFVYLPENKPMNIEYGKAYYTIRNDASLIAWRMPEQEPVGFHIAAAHSDSPAFLIKEHPEIKKKYYITLNVEKYGGMILSSWFDRALSIAGRVAVAGEHGIESRLVSIDRDLLVIPSLAIHMDRNVNAGKKFNVQEDMRPVYAQEDGAGIRELAAGAAGVQPGQIVGQELYLYVREKGHFVGRDGEWILAPRLDDQQCAYGVIQGLLSSRVHNKIAMAAVFHNEEVGSGTRQGADSTFLEDVITWITEAIGISDGGKRRMITNSFLISADNAHGIHPNYESKADPTNQPLLNGGIVLKFHGGQKYTSDAMTSGNLRTLCKGAGVSCQSYHNRSDIAGGSTLGNISTAHVSIPSVDIGLAQWAMHSAMETAGTKDLDALIRLCEHFYGVD